MPCCVYVHSYGHSGAGVVFMLTKYKNMLFELLLRTLEKNI